MKKLSAAGRKFKGLRNKIDAVVRKKSKDVVAPNAPRNCCLCDSSLCVRIELRNCRHVACIRCAIEHLKYWIVVSKKARIKCVSPKCSQRIHENDINALLDETEEGLDEYLSLEHRRKLQFSHNTHSIVWALATKDIEFCPLCKSLYTVEPGCSMVRCANAVCQTTWCWDCERPIGDWSTHYFRTIEVEGRSACSLGWKDYARFMYFFRIILAVHPLALWISVPIIFIGCFLFLPLLMFVTVIYVLMARVYENAHRNTDFLTMEEFTWMVAKMIVYFLCGIVLGLPVAFSTPYLVGFPILMIYESICFIRSNPCIHTVEDEFEKFLKVLKFIGRFFLVGPYGKMLKEARIERADRKDVHVQQEQFEESERAVRVDQDELRNERREARRAKRQLSSEGTTESNQLATLAARNTSEAVPRLQSARLPSVLLESSAADTATVFRPSALTASAGSSDEPRTPQLEPSSREANEGTNMEKLQEKRIGEAKEKKKEIEGGNAAGKQKGGAAKNVKGTVGQNKNAGKQTKERKTPQQSSARPKANDGGGGRKKEKG